VKFLVRGQVPGRPWDVKISFLARHRRHEPVLGLEKAYWREK